jgi:hypothetical protein
VAKTFTAMIARSHNLQLWVAQIGLVMGTHFYPSGTSDPTETWEAFIPYIYLSRSEVILHISGGCGANSLRGGLTARPLRAWRQGLNGYP